MSRSKSLSSVTLHRFTWMQVLLGDGRWGWEPTIGRTDTLPRPRKRDKNLVSPSFPGLPRPCGRVPASLLILGENGEDKSGYTKDGRSGACRQDTQARFQSRSKPRSATLAAVSPLGLHFPHPHSGRDLPGHLGSTTYLSPNMWLELMEPKGCIRRKGFSPGVPQRRQLSAHRICLTSTGE